MHAPSKAIFINTGERDFKRFFLIHRVNSSLVPLSFKNETKS
jgi:hypothetical protein